MKAFVLSVILLTLPVLTHGQKFFLPSDIADSALYLIKKGKACEEVKDKYFTEIMLMDSALRLTTKEVNLRDVIIENQNEIIDSFPLEVKTIKAIHEKERKRLKQKINRLVRVVILEGGFIVIMIVFLI